MESFVELLLEPLSNFYKSSVAFVPNLLAMVVIIVGGLVLARIIKVIVTKTLVVVNFDQWCDHVGLVAVMKKGEVSSGPSQLVGTAVFWFLALIAFMLGLSALRLESIDNLNAQFFLYLPSVLSAVFILVIGYVIAGITARAALVAAVNSGYSYAKLLAQSVRLLIVILAIAMALEQLHIAPGIVLAAFSIVFGGIVLTFSIAFGVGGISSARRLIEGDSTAGKKNGEEQVTEKKEEKAEKGRDMEYL